MDKMTQLLGRGLVRFDMRIPGKFIVRVSSEPGSVVPDRARSAAAAPGPARRSGDRRFEQKRFPPPPASWSPRSTSARPRSAR
jgi:hypothetical protein